MGERVIGQGPVSTGIIQEEIGGDVTVDKISVATGTRIFTGLKTDLVLQTPVYDSPHPEFPGLLCTRKTFKNLQNGRARATVEYKGLDPAYGAMGVDPNDPNSGLPEPEEEESTEVSEEPIETHPDFVSTLGGTKEAPLNNATFDAQGNFTGFASGSRYFGMTKYMKKRGVLRTTWLSRSKVSSADVGSVIGGKLVKSQNSQKTGGIYKNTRELLDGDWDPTIYPG